MNFEKSKEKTDILVLLWHSTIDSSITAGGIRRIIEFAKRIPEDMHFWILDNSPTVLDFVSPQFTVCAYKLPSFVYSLLKFNFVIGRSVEWFITSIKLMVNGARLIKQKRCKVVYVPTSGLLFLFLPAVFLKTFYKVKLLSDILNFTVPYGSVSHFYKEMRVKGYSVLRAFLVPLYIKLQLFIIKSLFSKIDCIVSVSQYLADLIKKQGARCPITFTPSGIDYKFIESIPQEPIYFEGIFVGRHKVEKGIFDLIEVWKKVVESLPHSRLAMVGFCDAATKEQINHKLRKYKLEQNVIIKGALDEKEKIRVIKSSKVFIHLGLIEPLVPVITVLEGLASGLPVVLYDQPSYKEHPEIFNHPSFALAPRGDYRAVAEGIISFLNMNGSLRDQVSQEAKEYARAYDWDNISQIEYAAIRQNSHRKKI